MAEFKRYTAVDRNIKDIKPEDNRVRITGTVLSNNNNTIVIDDSSSSIEIHFIEKQEISPGELVRIFALRDSNGFKGEIIQKPNPIFNLKLYMKAKKIFDDYKITT